MIAKVNGTKISIPVPIHVSFYWSDLDDAWIPWEMASYAYSGWWALF
jgi:hypothetical protein